LRIVYCEFWISNKEGITRFFYLWDLLIMRQYNLLNH
jgi:hypothetical protein